MAVDRYSAVFAKIDGEGDIMMVMTRYDALVDRKKYRAEIRKWFNSREKKEFLESTDDAFYTALNKITGEEMDDRELFMDLAFKAKIAQSLHILTREIDCLIKILEKKHES